MPSWLKIPKSEFKPPLVTLTPPKISFPSGIPTRKVSAYGRLICHIGANHETMKLTIIIALATMAIMLGCKPKEIRVSGQAFIVTQSAENIKLGDVEILLIEKQQAVEFLQTKQSAIESEVAFRQQELTSVENAFHSAEKIQTDLTNSTYNTNVDHAKIKAEHDDLLSQCMALNRKDESLRDARKETKDDASFAATEIQMKAVEDELFQKTRERESLRKTLDRIEYDFLTKKSAMLAEQNGKLEAAQSRLTIARARCANFPAGEDYFKDFLPAIVKKTLTDADGKFSFAYVGNKAFTIFATAQRAVLGQTERYYWLINAPASAETAPIFLSNNNLVSADPDGYFKIKPK
jgi:hypothetical protein